MKPPRIYSAMSAISRELARTGVAKSSVNADDGYAFRSVDEVMCALAPLLAKYRLCVLPRLSDRWCDPPGLAGTSHVTVKGCFDLVSAADGSSHTIETFGEAIDAGDKATSKAMTAAYKYGLIQAFCIPIRGSVDADRTSPKRTLASVEPVQGWQQWSQDLRSLIEGCDTLEAIERVVATYADQLRAMATAKRPEYGAIGQAICARKANVASPAPAPAAPKQRKLGNGSAAHAA